MSVLLVLIAGLVFLPGHPWWFAGALLPIIFISELGKGKL